MDRTEEAVPRQIIDQFLAPRCTHRTLDAFLARRALLNHLRSVLPRFTGTLLDVGCGQMPYRSLVLSPPSRAVRYIGLDFEPGSFLGADGRPIYGNRPDLTWDGQDIPLPDDTVDCAMATEVLEHCPDPEAVLREVCRVLKPGGLFFLSVPFLWPLHDVPHDEYRYTPFALTRHLSSAGFVDIALRATGGWNASLAQMIGLWARRHPMPPVWRRVACVLAAPLVRFLGSRDTVPSLEDGTPMIPGLTGTALKPGKAASDLAAAAETVHLPGTMPLHGAPDA